MSWLRLTSALGHKKPEWQTRENERENRDGVSPHEEAVESSVGYRFGRSRRRVQLFGRDRDERQELVIQFRIAASTG